MQGLLYDLEGTVYSPTFTKKGNKQYRYYVSQNMMQDRDHPNGVIARLPANQIEALVEKTLRGKLKSEDKSAELLDLDRVNDNFILNSLANNQKNISLEKLCGVIKKIIIDVSEIKFCIDRVEFRALVSDVLNWVIDESCSNATVEFSIPYKTQRTYRGAVTIKPNSDDSNDIFDLPPQGLKRLVQGVVWRDEHFNGATLRDIAKREKLSEGYIGKLIYNSLDV